ncbi:MAG: 30S ribosomal protein S6 [Chloroflexi bacterium]|nr:MAG: 30S ribosomal protein S6 [Chloroflexota bacterium]
MRDYELMYIVRPELDEDGVRGAVQSVRTLVEGQGGEIVKTTLWGKRRLAYDVQRMHDGHYVLVALRLDGERVGAVERALRIHDTVFRHLLVVHQGPMPEPDGEIEEVAPEEIAGETPADGEPAPVVSTPSAGGGDDDAEDEELAGAPSASDDEGDE